MSVAGATKNVMMYMPVNFKLRTIQERKIYPCFIDFKKHLTQFGTKDYSTNLLKVE